MTLQALALAVLTFLLLLCLLLILYVGLLYRGLTAMKRDLDFSFSRLHSALQERFEASGELMETCRGFIPRDSRDMRNVAQVRSIWAIADSKQEKLKSATDFDMALKNLIAAARAHPDLCSTDVFARVEKRLSGLEQHIAQQSEKYNSATGIFNSRLQHPLMSWMRGATGFTAQPYFAPSAQPNVSAFAAPRDSAKS